MANDRLARAFSSIFTSLLLCRRGLGTQLFTMPLNQYTLSRVPSDIPKSFETNNPSGDISLFWATIFLLLTFGVVYGGIRKGIERVE